MGFMEERGDAARQERLRERDDMMRARQRALNEVGTVVKEDVQKMRNEANRIYTQFKKEQQERLERGKQPTDKKSPEKKKTSSSLEADIDRLYSLLDKYFIHTSGRVEYLEDESIGNKSPIREGVLIFSGLLAVGFAYMAETTKSPQNRNIFIAFTAFFGAVAGTIQFSNFKRGTPLDYTVNFLVSGSMVMLILSFFMGMQDGLTPEISVLLIISLVGLSLGVTIMSVRKRTRDRERIMTTRTKII